MAFNVSAVPRGLMDLLNVRSEGAMPRSLDENLTIDIDGTEFYLSGKLETVAGNGTAPIVGFNALLTVPPNELWILMQANGNIASNDAGVSSRFAVAMNPPGGSVLLGNVVNVAALANEFAITNPLRVALPAGTRFGLYVFGIAGGVYTAATTTGATVLVYRLRAGG